GAHAKQRRIIDPQNTVYSVKRFIGRSYASPEVQIAKTRMPYKIKEGANQSPIIVTRGGEFAVPEISAIVLDHVRDIAASALDVGVNRAVITVPANFNDAQRSATATAGAIAGITVVRVLNEPTAAALAYGHSRPMQEIFAVYDFGGGTFDVTVLRLRDQVYEVLGTAGDSFLGGDDLDERLVDIMVNRFLSENRIDLRDDEIAMMRMRAVAEQAKIELSRRARAKIRIDEISYGTNGVAMNLQMEISRDEFVQAAADIVGRTFSVCTEAMKLAGTNLSDLGEVILVGGTTKMPYVREKVAEFFGQGPRTDANPEEAVALGASLQAVALQRILTRSKPATSRVSTPLRQPAAEAETTVTNANSVFDVPTVEAIATEAPARRTADYTAPPRASTARPMQRGATVDRFFEEPSTTTEAVTLARITRPGPAALPPVPPAPTTSDSLRRSRPISVMIPPLGEDSQFTNATEPVTQVVAATAVAPTPRPLTMPPVRTTVRAATVPPVPPLRPRPSSLPPLPSASMTMRDFDLPPPLPSSTGPNAPTTFGPPPEPPPSPPVAARSRSGFDLSLPTNPTGIGTAPAAAVHAAAVAVMAAPASATARGMTAAPIGPRSEVVVSPGDTNRAMPPPMVSGVPGTTLAPPFAMGAPLAPFVMAQPAVVVDVVPHSFGIATVGGFCEEIIRRNSQLPAESKRVFATSRDKQDTVRIRICQGQSRRLEENLVLGDLVLSKLPQRARSESAIEVTFAMDVSGMLRVHARDTVSGYEQRVSIDIIGAMSSEDVQASRERMRAFRRS
nr:Hsp70 family protein [Kofleriaceae bacterium]